MALRPADLPDFSNPPVVEVVLALRFEPLPIRAHQLGAVAALFEHDFPVVQERPPVDLPIEVFGGPPGRQRAVQFELVGGGSVLPRLWFIKRDDTALLQFQNNFFAANWRKQSDPYPHYEGIAANFRKSIEALIALLKGQDVGDVKPLQCEVTYVNQITLPDGAPGFKCPERMFSNWRAWATGSALPPIEDTGFTARFVLSAGDSGPIGRLMANMQPNVSRTDVPQTQFTLTARGRPLDQGIDGVMAFFDIGRAAIVKAFAAMTTTEMHAVWGRKQ